MITTTQKLCATMVPSLVECLIKASEPCNGDPSIIILGEEAAGYKLMLFGRTKGSHALAEYYKPGGPVMAATVLQNNRTAPAAG